MRYVERLNPGVGGNVYDAEDAQTSLRRDRQGLGLSRGTTRLMPQWEDAGRR